MYKKKSEPSFFFIYNTAKLYWTSSKLVLYIKQEQRQRCKIRTTGEFKREITSELEY